MSNGTTMQNPTNLNFSAIMMSIGSFVGSLSGLDVFISFGSFILAIFIGVSAIRRNKAQTNYYQTLTRKEASDKEQPRQSLQ